MSFEDLRSFMSALRRAGELVEIDEPVSVDQEIACAADRVSKLPDGGPALLFRNVTGPEGRKFDAPVLINALGSEKRLSMVCGVENFEGLRERLSGLLQDLQTPRRTLMEKLKALPKLKELANFFPRHVSRGPCQEIVQTGDAIDLREIPVLKTWPEDGGPFITFPLVFTHGPEDGKRNCGMYRIQIYDRNTTGFHVHTHHTAAEHMRQAKRLGKTRLEAAIAIGGEPAVTFAAVIPLPPGIDEMIMAGFLQGRPVKMVPCKTVGVQVPAGADYVIEGYVEIDEKRREGPFGDHTGFYSLADDYPVFHVTAVTRRREPTYFATVVGPPSQEDCWMGRAIERLFLPLMQQTVPEVQDYRLPFSGVFHNLMLARIRKSWPGQGRKVAHAVWGLGQAMFTKVICVGDEQGPKPADEAAFARHLYEHADLCRDLEIVFGPTETLDHATRALHFGSKVSLDASRKLPEEGRWIPAHGDAANEAEPDLAGIEHVASWRAWEGGPLAVVVRKQQGYEARAVAKTLFERAGEKALPLVIVLSEGLVQPGDNEGLVWATLANIDPERDLLFDERPFDDHGRLRLSRHPRRLVIDATRKDARDGFARDWPEVQRHPPHVVSRMRELLAGRGVSFPMPPGI